jgi:hypothetical protein
VSLDRPDFQRRVTQLQRGASPDFFPVVINPLIAGPGNTPLQVGQSVSIPIQPCDHLWLPTCFDATIAINPAQGDGLANGAGQMMMQPPGASRQSGVYPPVVGTNVFDAFSGGEVLQSAAIFALQFNSPSAPWLLWSLSDGLLNVASQPVATVLTIGSANAGIVGQGDFMRSITGPIQSMNFKLVKAAQVWSTASGTPVSSIAASMIVLLSTIGYSQQTSGGKQLAFNLLSGGLTDQSIFYPQFMASPSSYSTSGGGYTQTKLNTLENACLEREGVIDPRRA